MTVSINWRSMYTVIKKEFMDSVRNKWIIAVTVIFVLLALITSYFGSATEGTTGFQGFAITIVLLLVVSTYLVTIIGLMLGYGAVVSEKERGSLDLLLSMPISRTEAFTSKFVGLMLVLFVSVFVGFGSAGIVIAATAGTSSWAEYLLFLGATFLLGLVFLSLGMMLSTLMKKRSTAIGGAVLLWFLFIFIYDVIIFGIFVATGGDIMNPEGLPGWFYASELGNPAAAYSFLSQTILLTAQGAPISPFPWFINGFSTAGALLAWLFIPIIIGLLVFTRKDV